LALALMFVIWEVFVPERVRPGKRSDEK
jgi:hypothetical protein